MDIIKACSKCGQIWPRTNEYFKKRKTSTDGLDSWCKKCCAKYLEKYREINKDVIAEYKNDTG